jgi:hypothetical protein
MTPETTRRKLAKPDRSGIAAAHRKKLPVEANEPCQV